MYIFCVRRGASEQVSNSNYSQVHSQGFFSLLSAVTDVNTNNHVIVRKLFKKKGKKWTIMNVEGADVHNLTVILFLSRMYARTEDFALCSVIDIYSSLRPANGLSTMLSVI